MTRITALVALLALTLLGGCASRRVLMVENRLVHQENDDLRERMMDMERRMPAPGTYSRHPDLAVVHEFLERAGYSHSYSAGASVIRMEFAGRNTAFTIQIQHFASAEVLFLSTDDYLHMDKAANTESVVLLLVQLAALNYELLVGKFQVNPETGEVLLSVELPIRDGLGYDTFVHALEQLLHTADTRYPELERAAAGLGL